MIYLCISGFFIERIIFSNIETKLEAFLKWKIADSRDEFQTSFVVVLSAFFPLTIFCIGV